MPLADITRDAVEEALKEYDALGSEAFLARYGFADAKRYWIAWEGRRYPSKAIAGVAHRFVDGEQLLPSNSFTGGEASVVRKLRQLGFELDILPRNPDWNRDEIILALDLYFTNPDTIPGKSSKLITDLSALLNAMHQAIGTEAGDTIRNPNGVYLKLMNLRSLDPAYTDQGKVGMKSGGKLERFLWTEYAGRRSELAADAAIIREAIAKLEGGEVRGSDQAEAYEGEEGGVVIRLHRRYERDSRLVAEKRKQAQKNGGAVCEVCSFNFGATYGSLGADYIEVHHTKPVHLMQAGSKTKLADLALLCANCHRMAHRKRTPLGLDELRSALRQPLEG